MLRTAKRTSLSSTKLSKNTKNTEVINVDEMLTMSVSDLMRSNLVSNFRVEHNIVKQ